VGLSQRTKQFSKAEVHEFTGENWLHDFLGALARSRVGYKAFDAYRLAKLYAKTRGYDARSRNEVLAEYREAVANPFNYEERQSRLLEVLQEERPPYVASVLGEISHIISNPLTNGGWKNLRPRDVGRGDTFLATIFAGVNIWVDQQINKPDAAYFIRQYGLKRYLEGYPFDPREAGS